MEQETVTLKEHIETLIDNNDRRYEQRFNDANVAVGAALAAAEKAVAAALAGQKEAVTKAEVAAEKRFESVNEFRNTLSDQQRMLLPRLEAEVKFINIEKNFDSMIKEISSLRETRSLNTGKSEGVGVGWAWIVGAITVIAAVIALVLNAVRLLNVGM